MAGEPGAEPAMTAFSSGSRVIVTGGAGFLGSHLCDRMVDAGIQVECWDNLSTGGRQNIAHLNDNPRFHLRVLDVCHPPRVCGSVDVVFHLASPASPTDYGRLPLETMRVGSIGTLAMLDLAVHKGARFVLASTSEVYGDPEEHPQREEYRGNVDPTGPRAVYDEAKRFSEAATAMYHRNFDLDAGIARIFNTFGPRLRADDGRVVPTLIRQALAGYPLTIAGTGKQTRSLCYVDDTVEGLIRLAGSASHGPVNIGSSQELTVLDIAELVLELTGTDVELRHVPLPEGDPTRRRADVGLARELLGWEPKVPLREGIRRTIEWMARN